MGGDRQVRVLISPRSSAWAPASGVQQALSQHWDVPGIDLSLQLSKTPEDGREKARRAIEAGVDTVLVVGGDGMVNTIGGALVGSPVALGVIPAGSGNGFARHFDIPLNPAQAVQALVDAERHVIDVGTANGRPFFVTCSMAWDAQLVRAFETFPVRGILPYVFAAASELVTYTPQPFEILVDGSERLELNDVMVCTVANLTQYGGGAMIAPRARDDDGLLELVIIRAGDMPWVLASLNKLFDGTIDQLQNVLSRRFRTVSVRRAKSAAIQVDGELVDAPPVVEVDVLPKSLTVLVPRRG